MEAKKNPKADLTRKTGFFFSIALLVTMSIVLTAFEWKQHEATIAELVQRNVDVFDDMDVVATEIPPPPPPVIKTPIIVEVPDDVAIEEMPTIIDIEVPEDAALKPIEVTPIEVPEEPTDVPFVFVEDPANFEGGIGAFYKKIGEAIKYPTQAKRMGIEGRVYVEFVINRDGTVTDVKAVSKIGGGCDEEAVRVISNSPAWKPGKQRGKPVRQKMILPVIFKLH